MVKISDDGLLITYNGACYATYVQDEINGYRIFVGSGSEACTFLKEKDPSILRAPSPGKLLRYHCNDGDMLDVGDIYAEMEVMKLVITLYCQIRGRITFIRQPGSVVEMGSVLAKLDLSDSSQPKEIRLCTLLLQNNSSNLELKGTKTHQVFRFAVEKLQNVLNGFTYPDSIVHNALRDQIITVFNTIRDPSLPLLEMQEIVSSLAGRIPIQVEKCIHAILSCYYSNLTSVFVQFPSQQIANCINDFAKSIESQHEIDAFNTKMEGIIELTEKYRYGTKGHLKSLAKSLLLHYLKIEELFQSGSFESVVNNLRDIHKESIDELAAIVFSHCNFEAKNCLVLCLLEHLLNTDATLIGELTVTLMQLSSLTNHRNADVALKSRQIMITYEEVPYELRHNLMESIFLNAVEKFGHPLCEDGLEKLIMSEASIFEVLHSFYFHSNIQICTAALEVYIRRAYLAFEINSVQHELLLGELPMILFSLKLPRNHPERVLRKPSYGYVPMVRSTATLLDIGHFEELPCERLGLFCAFRNWSQFEQNFGHLVERLTSVCIIKMNRNQQIRPSVLHRRCQSNILLRDASVTENIYIVNIFIKNDEEKQRDTDLPSLVSEFILNERSVLIAHKVRRVTVSIARRGQLPLYFTFRASLDFKEDQICRNIEPALAFQLEIFRMKFYSLELIPTSSYKIHIYLGKSKEDENSRSIIDYRFFLRCLIYHSDVLTMQASTEYLANEAERTLFESLEELEIAHAQASNRKIRTDCNHIFMCFIPTVCIEVNRLEETIRTIVLRYGLRLIGLRVHQAELKMTIRSPPNSSTPQAPISPHSGDQAQQSFFCQQHQEAIPIRVLINNDSGYGLDISIYRETIDNTTGQTVFESLQTCTSDNHDICIGHSKRVIGPWHGRSLYTPYFTRDIIQHRRFQAQLNETTYVYDYPNLFKQVVKERRNKHCISKGDNKDVLPKQNNHEYQYAKLLNSVSPNKEMFKFVELILDQDNKQTGLKEIERKPGLNNIGMVAWIMNYVCAGSSVGTRKIIVIANDITFSVGSFGTKEDELFYVSVTCRFSMYNDRIIF
ncbi:hypothetical protein GJ496_009866 [Pomphorhynchus laevis]|nr:hypothetical protein GJ496_009866 [Pomphorhynchus laevis]